MRTKTLIVLLLLGFISLSLSLSIINLTPSHDMPSVIADKVDSNHNGRLSSRELKNVKKLDLSSLGLDQLEGIEALEHLTHLYLNGNQLYNLQPLNQLENLIQVDLSNNPNINFTSLSTLPQLQSLRASLCNIDYLNFDGNHTLRELTLSGNLLTSLDSIENLLNLENLYVDDNKIVDISPLVNSHKLKALDIRNNPIEDWSVLKDMGFLDTLIVSKDQYEAIKKSLPSLLEADLFDIEVPN